MVDELQAASAVHWAEGLADEVEQRWRDTGTGEHIVCASGISPSGSIHLGNLREVMTTHLVAEALRSRGLPAVHLHSWDDYDRLRKVPAGLPASLEQYVGMPLAEIPDPTGVTGSYADRFIDEFSAALIPLGIELTSVRQSQRYPIGTYNAEIRRAIDERELIFDTLEQQRTPGRQAAPAADRRRTYYPFTPYCNQCRFDATEVLAYDGASIDYRCRRCRHEGQMSLADGASISGKLVWKVDWPMRWKHEGVHYEPAGEDHHAPAGSFTVGRTLVREVFGGEPPLSTVYSFVTVSGRGGKMSGSVGGAVTPGHALEVFEPVIVRWPYVQRQPSQSIAIDISPRGIQRQYDHWDQFAARASAASADGERAIWRRSTETTVGAILRTPRPVSFRLLSSVADLTNANRPQIARIVARHLDEPVSETDLLAQLEPRLSCAIHFATSLIPADQRTVMRTTFNEPAWKQLDEHMQAGLDRLVEAMRNAWSLEGLTQLVYGVPKVMLGLRRDAPATPEVKHLQREFFKTIYRLVCDSETGPRVPTLLLSLGPQRAAQLLGDEAGSARGPSIPGKGAGAQRT